MGAPESDKAAIRQTIRALRQAGYTLTGGHDGEAFFEVKPDASEDSIIANLMACDDSTLRTFKEDVEPQTSHVYFVLGNEPYEVICDHGVSLSPVLDPLTDGWQDD